MKRDAYVCALLRAAMENPSQWREFCRAVPACVARRRLLQRVEESCFRQAKQVATDKRIEKRWTNPIFRSLYSSILDEMFNDIKRSDLLARLASGAVSADAVAQLSTYERNPAATQRIRAGIELRAKQAIHVEASPYILCYKCGKKGGVSYIETNKRTLGNDEACAVDYTCTCGHKWIG